MEVSQNKESSNLINEGETSQFEFSSKGEEGGILLMSLKSLFSAISKNKQKSYFVKICYFEIYNDLVYDLLADIEQFGDPLPVCEDIKVKILTYI